MPESLIERNAVLSPEADERLYVRLLCRLVAQYPRATWSAHCRHGAVHYAQTRPVLGAWLADAAMQYEALLPPATPVQPCPHEHVNVSGACNDCGECVAQAAGDETDL